MSQQRKFAQGAEVTATGVVDFRIYAPERRQVELALLTSNRTVSLTREADGFWSLRVDGIGAGERYAYRLDGAPPTCPTRVPATCPRVLTGRPR